MKDTEHGLQGNASSGWNLAAALGLVAAAFLWDRISPPEDESHASKRPARRDRAALNAASDGGEDRGRLANSPSEIPAKGWKDILLRVYGNIGKHRVLALAAGMTYYSILAIFPALAALVATTGSSPIPAASPSTSIRYPDSCRAAPSTSHANSWRASRPKAASPWG
jgi:membrane protein